MRTVTIFTNIVLFVFISHAHCTTNVGSFFTGTVNKRVPSPVMETTSAGSAISCCFKCDHVVTCNSVSYHASNNTCLLSTEPLITVNVYGQTSTDWITYSKKDWKLVFRGTPGAGGNILQSLYNGVSVTTDDVKCMTTNVTSCSKHYRHPIVDSWTSIGVEEVKVVYYKDNTEGAFVIFNATGSGVSNWFSSTRVLNSSWTSLKSGTFVRFSMTTTRYWRRLIILRRHPGKCKLFGYTVTIATIAKKGQCSYEKYGSYPQFLYSKTDSYDDFTDFDVADVFAIFIM